MASEQMAVFENNGSVNTIAQTKESGFKNGYHIKKAHIVNDECYGILHNNDIGFFMSNQLVCSPAKAYIGKRITQTTGPNHTNSPGKQYNVE
jgi:hypothetical protein